MKQRPRPIGFQSRQQVSLTDNRYKLISTNGKTFALYDLIEDPGEKKDISADKPEITKTMKATLAEWRASCARSRAGKDY